MCRPVDRDVTYTVANRHLPVHRKGNTGIPTERGNTGIQPPNTIDLSKSVPAVKIQHNYSDNGRIKDGDLTCSEVKLKNYTTRLSDALHRLKENLRSADTLSPSTIQATQGTFEPVLPILAIFVNFANFCQFLLGTLSQSLKSSKSLSLRGIKVTFNVFWPFQSFSSYVYELW